MQLWEIRGGSLHDESHSPDVLQWKAQAADAFRRGDGKTAESLLLRALEREPGAPDLLNNLAGAWDLQGRHQEALELARQIHHDHPDYVFARTNLAMQLARAGAYEESVQLLKETTLRKQWYAAELEAICAAHVEVYWRKGDREVAASWLEIWKSTRPDSSHMERWEQRLSGALP